MDDFAYVEPTDLEDMRLRTTKTSDCRLRMQVGGAGEGARLATSQFTSVMQTRTAYFAIGSLPFSPSPLFLVCVVVRLACEDERRACTPIIGATCIAASAVSARRLEERSSCGCSSKRNRSFERRAVVVR